MAYVRGVFLQDIFKSTNFATIDIAKSRPLPINFIIISVFCYILSAKIRQKFYRKGDAQNTAADVVIRYDSFAVLSPLVMVQCMSVCMNIG